MVPVFGILERFSYWNAYPVRGLLDVAEDRTPHLVIVPLQADVVRVGRDSQIIDLRERVNLFLEGVVGHVLAYLSCLSAPCPYLR